MHNIEWISEMGEGHGICLLSSSHSCHVARLAIDNFGNMAPIVKRFAEHGKRMGPAIPLMQ